MVILFDDCEGIEYLCSTIRAVQAPKDPTGKCRLAHLPSHCPHQDPSANHSHSPRSQHTYSTSSSPSPTFFPLAPALVANVAIVPGSQTTRRAVLKIRQALKKVCSTSCCIRLGALPTSVGLHLHVSQDRCCPPSPSAYARPSEARMTTCPRA